MKSLPKRQARWVSLDELHEDPANVRKHGDRNRAAVRASLREFGQVEPLVVQARTGRVLGGNCRLAELRALGQTEALVLEVAVEGSDATRLALALNQTAVLAEWDEEGLEKLLRDLSAEGLEVPGFDEETLTELLKDSAPPVVEEDEDTPLLLPVEPVSRLGEVYELGPHRLVCGDSTKAEIVALLMGKDKADMVWSDPPYNVGAGMSEGFYAGTNSPQMKALSSADWDKAFDIVPALERFSDSIARDVTVYLCTSQHLAGAIWAWMRGWADFHSFTVWCKPSPMPSLAKRHWTWSTELICYATRGRHCFNFPEEGHALSHWVMSNRDGDRVHPTQKPVALVAHAILHSSKPEGVIADFFAGSGSTLIAAAQTGRIARLIELDPRYCDVIRRRWTRWARANNRDPGPGALEEST